MNNLQNSKFTKGTSTNLGRFHRFAHICAKMMYGKIGEYRLNVNRYDITDITCKQSIKFWEGPIAYLMFPQFLTTNAGPLHVSYCRSFFVVAHMTISSHFRTKKSKW